MSRMYPVLSPVAGGVSPWSWSPPAVIPAHAGSPPPSFPRYAGIHPSVIPANAGIQGWACQGHALTKYQRARDRRCTGVSPWPRVTPRRHACARRKPPLRHSHACRKPPLRHSCPRRKSPRRHACAHRNPPLRHSCERRNPGLGVPGTCFDQVSAGPRPTLHGSQPLAPGHPPTSFLRTQESRVGPTSGLL